MSLLASVRSTIGRFSSIRSSAWEGKNPTYVSVFALMSTYDAVLQSEAVVSLYLEFDVNAIDKCSVLTKVTSNPAGLDSEQKLFLCFVTSYGLS